MIAIEEFKRFRLIDFLLVVFMAGVWSIFGFAFDSAFSPLVSYIASLAFLIAFVTFTLLLVKKVGTATLLLVIAALFTNGVGDIGPTGIYKIMTFLVAGLVFEAIFLVLKLEYKSVPIDIVASSAIAAAIIPIVVGMLLSLGIAIDQLTTMINLVLLSLFIGILSSLLTYLLWYNVRTIKFIIKLENALY